MYWALVVERGAQRGVEMGHPQRHERPGAMHLADARTSSRRRGRGVSTRSARGTTGIGVLRFTGGAGAHTVLMDAHDRRVNRRDATRLPRTAASVSTSITSTFAEVAVVEPDTRAVATLWVVQDLIDISQINRRGAERVSARGSTERTATGRPPSHSGWRGNSVVERGAQRRVATRRNGVGLRARPLRLAILAPGLRLSPRCLSEDASTPGAGVGVSVHEEARNCSP